MIPLMIQAFTLYFMLLICIGIYFYYKNKSDQDFNIGNRKLNYWITAISAQASDMSDWLFMGFPGIIYAQGMIGMWTACGLVFFMFLTWHYIAPRFRIETESTESVTLASFLQQKFKAQNNYIRIISGLFCLYFFTFYIAAGLAGLGRVFEYAFAVNYYHGVIFGFIITITYSLLGGFLAIAWSNLLQGLFLLYAIVLVPCYGIYQIGGITIFIEALQRLDYTYLSAFPTQHSFLHLIFAIMAWGLGYFGQPHILINFMSIDNVKNMKKAQYVGISWQMLVLSAAILVGLVGKIYITPSLTNSELVFISMVTSMFTPFFAGLILCAMLAATISTINTQSLISASLITHDLYYPFIATNLSHEKKLLFTRLALVIIPILSLLVTFYSTQNIFESVHYAWSGLGASFGPLVILALYTNFVTPQGALAGLVTGGLTGILWSTYNHSIPTLIIGFIINFSMTYIISRWTR